VERERERLLLKPNGVFMKLGTFDSEGGRLPAVAEAEKLTLERTVADRHDERSRVVELYWQEFIIVDEVERQLGAIKAEAKAASARLGEVKRGLSNADALKQRCTTIEERLDEMRDLLNSGVSYQVRRQIVELLVDRVMVTMIGRGASVVLNLRSSSRSIEIRYIVSMETRVQALSYPLERELPPRSCSLRTAAGVP